MRFLEHQGTRILPCCLQRPPGYKEPTHAIDEHRVEPGENAPYFPVSLNGHAGQYGAIKQKTLPLPLCRVAVITEADWLVQCKTCR